MDRIRIRGGKTLKGEIRISGAKNAALPLMCTALLTDKEIRFDRIPDLADITTMTNLLAQHGVEVTTKLSGKERSVTVCGTISDSVDIAWMPRASSAVCIVPKSVNAQRTSSCLSPLSLSPSSSATRP